MEQSPEKPNDDEVDKSKYIFYVRKGKHNKFNINIIQYRKKA